MPACPALQPSSERGSPGPAVDAASRFAPETWRPVAFVSLQATGLRDLVRAALEHAGWTVVEHPTGFHIVRALADLIEGRAVWRRPALIVVDAWSRGCAGVSLAIGLHELGVEIPIVVVAADVTHDERVSIAPRRAYVVDPAHAPRLVAALAHRLRTPAAGEQAIATSALAVFKSTLTAYPHSHFHVHSLPHPRSDLRKEDTL
jgi:DNA-binding response OmpR family regulator